MPVHPSTDADSDVKRWLEVLKKIGDGATMFDWTELGITTYEDYVKLSEFLILKSRTSPDIRKLCTAFTLSSPLLNFYVTHFESPETPAGVPIGYGPGGYRAFGTASNKSRKSISKFTSSLEPIRFCSRGTLSHRELTGSFDRAFKTDIKSAEKDDVIEVVSRLVSKGRTYIDKLTPEANIQSAMADSCIKRVIASLNLSKDMNLSSESVACKDITESPHLRHTGALCVDLLISGSFSDDTHNDVYPLLAIEIKKPPMMNIVSYLEWDFYDLSRRFGHPSAKPSDNKPDISHAEMKRYTGIMTQLLGYCFAYGIDEIVLFDGVSATVVKFFFKSARYLSNNLRNRRSDPKGVNCIDFKSTTTFYDSHVLPVTYLMTAMAWRRKQHLQSTYDSESDFHKLRRHILKAAQTLVR